MIEDGRSPESARSLSFVDMIAQLANRLEIMANGRLDGEIKASVLCGEVCLLTRLPQFSFD
jgi:hypothetical protein